MTTLTATRRGWWDRPGLRELAMTLGLFALWQIAVQETLVRSAGAYSAGRWLWDLERFLRLPNEVTVQQLVVGHHAALWLVNEWYDGAHFPGMLALLIWAYRRDATRYVAVRRLTVTVTATWLAIAAAIPTAPPRLLHLPGLIDTAQLLGVSEYSNGHVDQFSTFPSLHVAWSLIVALALVRLLTDPLRWIALGYPALTIAAVVITGNHTWIDCAGAAAIVTAAYYLTPGVRNALRSR